MSFVYHILNGDCLKDQFPTNIEGELIVARESLIDGDVNGDSLHELFETRSKFISLNYEGFTEKDYFKKTVPEIKKIVAIPDKSEVFLWFEDDLFCQVNMWFVIHLLYKYTQDCKVFLVRPKIHNQLGFGGFNKEELVELYQDSLPITDLSEMAKLWIYYQKNDNTNLVATADKLENTFPFIKKAVEANMARIPNENALGRPKQSIIQIIKDLKTTEFSIVFKEFCKRESIYGFGDLQVKRLFDEVLKSRY